MQKPLAIIKEIVITVAIALVLFFLLRTFVLTSSQILSPSMVPTLNTGDRIISLKFSYWFGEPKRGDIIVFEAPPEGDEGYDYIKRIIALPGETVEIENGYVYIDDRALEEPYIAEKPQDNFGPVTVPEGEYFVLGDNRNKSLDSHAWSYHFVPEGDIDGKVVFQYYPFNEFSLFHYDNEFYPQDPAIGLTLGLTQ